MYCAPLSLSKNLRRIDREGHGGEGFPALQVIFRLREISASGTNLLEVCHQMYFGHNLLQKLKYINSISN